MLKNSVSPGCTNYRGMNFKKGFNFHWTGHVSRELLFLANEQCIKITLIDQSFLFTCRLLFIISTPKLVVSGNFSSIRIVLSCFYLLIKSILINSQLKSAICRMREKLPIYLFWAAKSPYSSSTLKGSSKHQPPKPAARNMWITAMRSGTSSMWYSKSFNISTREFLLSIFHRLFGV